MAPTGSIREASPGVAADILARDEFRTTVHSAAEALVVASLKDVDNQEKLAHHLRMFGYTVAKARQKFKQFTK